MPTPSIYLRNKFAIKHNAEAAFLEGKEEFLRNTRGPWKLVAAFGQWSLMKGQPPIVSSAPMFHIWKLQEWSTLYETMYAFSETAWYRKLGHSLLSEDQDFLVSAIGRTEVFHPTWNGADRPPYVYVYDESRPKEGMTHRYLRDLNWFSAQMAPLGWHQVWVGSQITSQPSDISTLWRVDKRLDDIQKDLHEMLRDRTAAPNQRPPMSSAITA